MKKLMVVAALLAAGAGAYLLRPVSASPMLKAESKTRNVVAAGRVEPASEEVDVNTEIDGRLRRVHVAEGQNVRRGQVIAELENADFVARVQLAKATVAERQAALARASNGSRPMQRRESSAVIREAEAVLENASAERERRRILLDKGAISRTEFESADREWSVARARLDVAKERNALVEDEVRPEERDRAAAEVDQAKARLQEAEALLGKTIIRSPIDGVVLRKFKNAGESLSVDGRQPLVTLGDCRRLRVRAEVDEGDVAQVRVGQTAFVTAAAYGEKRFTGRVVRVGQILGRKKLQSDAPAERIDTKVLETLVELDVGQSLPIGLRVDSFIEVQR